MLTTILTFVLLVGSYFVIEVIVRQRSAKNVERGRSDRSSTIAIVASYAVAFLLLLFLSVTRAGSLSSALIGWLGLSVILLGLALHVWSMRALGASYSRTLRTTETQSLVDSGPYKVIRHPGYLLLAQMIPPVIIANSLYVIFNRLGLLNTYVGLIIADSSLARPVCGSHPESLHAIHPG